MSRKTAKVLKSRKGDYIPPKESVNTGWVPIPYPIFTLYRVWGHLVAERVLRHKTRREDFASKGLIFGFFVITLKK
jgi:hypothetical protein